MQLVELLIYEIQYCQITIQMLQAQSNISLKQTSPKKNQQLSLPNIHKRAGKQENRKSQTEIRNRDILHLPSISANNSEVEIDSPEHTFQSSDTKRNNKNALAKEVKNKLSMVLGEMPNLQSIDPEQNEQSDGSDFEAKINKNKQLIKQHRLRRQTQANQNGQQISKKSIQQKKSTNNSKNNNKNVLKMRNQSLYEKRVKQYKDQSIENRYIQKKKQDIKIKQKEKDKLLNFLQHNNSTQKVVKYESPKQPKHKDDFTSLKNQKLNDKNKVQLGKSSKKKEQARSPSFKQPQEKNIYQISKTVSLFDGIQNYLENRDSKKKQPNHIAGLTLLKAKRDIEDKIKDINQKLGIVQSIQQYKNIDNKQLQIESTGKNWRRVQISKQKLNCQNSNFDHELDRISSLQQRNSICLQKFIQTQQILLQLQMRRKQLLRKQPANSH